MHIFDKHRIQIAICKILHEPFIIVIYRYVSLIQRSGKIEVFLLDVPQAFTGGADWHVLPILCLQKIHNIAMLPVQRCIDCGSSGAALHHSSANFVDHVHLWDGARCRTTCKLYRRPRRPIDRIIDPNTATGHQATLGLP